MEQNKNRLFTFVVYLVAFFIGAIILVLEILGTRIVAPYYGTTIFVWSSLIGVTLVGLAVGYFLGGWIADKRPDTFTLSLIIACAAILFVVIHFASRPLLLLTDSLGPWFGPLLSAALLFICPMILLGMVAPFTVKLTVRELQKTGSAAGSLFGVSTVGSVIGALLSGFFLIPTFGITSLLDGMAVTLVLLSAVVAFTGKKRKTASVVPVVLIAAVIGGVLAVAALQPRASLSTGIVTSRVVVDTQSTYSRIRVMDYANRYRGLLVEGAVQTLYDTSMKEFPSDYINLFAKARAYHGSAKTALVIGLGGGALDSLLRKHGMDVMNVEIDPAIKSLAEKYFDFNGKAVIDDGRHFMRNTTYRYDIIYIDAFSGFSICPYLVTKEALEDARNRLNAGGILVVNMVGKIAESGSGAIADDRLTKVFHATLKQVFGFVAYKATNTGIANIVYFASDRTLKMDDEYLDINIPSSTIVFTDNINPAELLVADIIAEWRKEMIENLGKIFPL